VAVHLVTGAAGFIGSNLVRALARSGEHVRALDNLVTGYWENLDALRGSASVEFITADVRDAPALSRACRGVEVVFHQAGLGSVPRSIEQPVETDSVNCGGTVQVLDVARHTGVRRVIFAASSSAYGDAPTLPKHEDMPARPLSPYAVSKLGAEHYLRVFSSVYGLETLGLRYFNVFGPNQRPDGPYAAAIPRFMWAALHRQAPTIFGDGGTTRDFCYVDNAVDANLRAAAAPGPFCGQLANVATGRRVSLNDLVERIGHVLGRQIVPEHADPRPGDIRHSLADVTRARELFGYEPRVTWEQGLPPTASYLRSLAEQRGLECEA
jgi:nucleoside-diphosphate-sugar epimerase